jgi:hypothetical protein
MREALTELLNARFLRCCVARVGGIAFAHGDGWIGILDALLSVLEPRGTDVAIEAREKMAGLRFTTVPTRLGECDRFPRVRSTPGASLASASESIRAVPGA